MTAYRDLTVDLTTPTTKLDRCAVAILDVLTANTGQRMYVWDVDAAIINAKRRPAVQAAGVEGVAQHGSPDHRGQGSAQLVVQTGRYVDRVRGSPSAAGEGDVLVHVDPLP